MTVLVRVHDSPAGGVAAIPRVIIGCAIVDVLILMLNLLIVCVSVDCDVVV